MRWKIVAAVLAVLLVASNGYHVYHSFDCGLTLSYRDQVLYELANQLKATATLANVVVKGKTEVEALGMLKRLFPGEEPFVKEGAINTTWLSLKLGRENVVEAVQIDETASHWALSANERE
jgi:hypothetical protein